MAATTISRVCHRLLVVSFVPDHAGLSLKRGVNQCIFGSHILLLSWVLRESVADHARAVA